MSDSGSGMVDGGVEDHRAIFDLGIIQQSQVFMKTCATAFGLANMFN